MKKHKKGFLILLTIVALIFFIFLGGVFMLLIFPTATINNPAKQIYSTIENEFNLKLENKIIVNRIMMYTQFRDVFLVEASVPNSQLKAFSEKAMPQYKEVNIDETHAKLFCKEPITKVLIHQEYNNPEYSMIIFSSIKGNFQEIYLVQFGKHKDETNTLMEKSGFSRINTLIEVSKGHLK